MRKPLTPWQPMHEAYTLFDLVRACAKWDDPRAKVIYFDARFPALFYKDFDNA